MVVQKHWERGLPLKARESFLGDSKAAYVTSHFSDLDTRLSALTHSSASMAKLAKNTNPIPGSMVSIKALKGKKTVPLELFLFDCDRQFLFLVATLYQGSLRSLFHLSAHLEFYCTHVPDSNVSECVYSLVH